MAFGTATTTYSAPRPVVSSPDGKVPAYVPNSKIARLLPAFKAFATPLGLTTCQQRFAESFFTGANVCLSGAAGCGKSFVTQSLFTFLTTNKVSVGRTGTTGVASFNIGGQTIHSWAGLGLADEHVESIIEKAKKKTKAVARMRSAEVLFIDEVSMAKGDLLNKLDIVLKYFRRNNDPFGGIQLVCAADWLQLPPVFKNGEKQEFAFQSRAWREATFKVVVMTQVVRQQEGSVLLSVLNELRVGNTDSLHLLAPRIGATWSDSEIEPVRIFCKNVDVDSYNKERLEQLKTQAKVYEAKDSGSEYATDYFNKNCPAPQTLELRVGAQVMLLSNVDTKNGLVNGSVGVVKAFGPQGVTVKFAAGGTAVIDRVQWEQKEQEVSSDGKIRYKVVATRNQVPLKVAYASTVHKCQGMTLDRAIIDVGDAFSSGQAYVALSRVRNLESLSLVGEIPASAIKVSPECVRFYEEAE